MECHIENDTLLIWYDKEQNVVELVRLGSHSELFGKGRKKWVISPPEWRHSAERYCGGELINKSYWFYFYYVRLHKRGGLCGNMLYSLYLAKFYDIQKTHYRHYSFWKDIEMIFAMVLYHSLYKDVDSSVCAHAEL